MKQTRTKVPEGVTAVTNAVTGEVKSASSGNSDLLSRVEIILPYITDELWEMFCKTYATGCINTNNTT